MSSEEPVFDEDRIRRFWNEQEIFKGSLERSKGNPTFVMYDGPPFATGLPHYGHLVASTIKDIIPRWKTQTGHHVPRRWGWDTHGLPIEFKIEQKLGIKTKQQILELGIDKYNAECRDIVMSCAEQWKDVINRLGRWVDMENDYKTMDSSFMESVWWVFSELYKKGLVYRGYKVIYYSMGCKSPISNFEAKSNYQRVSDWAINVKFRVINEGKKKKQRDAEGETVLLVFTTTPWTLPANLAISVNPQFDYCKIQIDGEPETTTFIVGKPHLERTLGKRSYTLLETVKGSELVGMRYRPLFDYFKDYHASKTFRVYGADFVVAEKGTGLVHCAPAHGEEDYGLCLSQGLFSKTEIPVCPLDDDCNFTNEVKHFKGRNVKDCEDDIVAHLKETDQLFSKGKEVHDYPMCWRSDTPLVQKVCECWFIDVPQITEQLLSNNAGVHWTPDFVGSNRFGEWLKNSQEWCVSRNRFWGTPMPIWTDSNGTEFVVVNSTAQLEKLAGLEPGTVTDLHRDSIDRITIPSPTTGQPLHRVEYTFDCWFESGSMPYAQHHFPFADGSEFRPADFIAEGLDQTRGWFYTLLVIGTGLFGTSPYKNVIVNGIVLAKDGEKMSKRKNNYPPVTDILDKFGADALRLYLINTPVVRAGDIRFNPDDIREVARRFLMMYNNANKFFHEMVGLYNHNRGSTKTKYLIKPVLFIKQDGGLTAMDEWILQCLNELITSVTALMDKYQLNGIVEKFYKFIDQLSRWYMNLNKKRFKRCESTVPLDVLGVCLYNFSVVCAPFAPFSTESVYQDLRDLACPNNELASIHYHQIPTNGVWDSDGGLLELFDYVSDIVDVIRIIRNKRANTSTKMPLPRITLVNRDQSILDTLKLVESQLRNQFNIEQIEYSTDVDGLVVYDLQPDVQLIKQRIEGRAIGQAIGYVKRLSVAQKQQIGSTRKVPDNCPVLMEELKVIKSARPGIKVETTNRITVEYDDSITQQLTEKFTANQFYRQYQQSRKEAKLVQTDQVIFEYSCPPELNDILNKHGVPEQTNAVYIPEGIDPDMYPNYLVCTKPSLELGEVTILLRK